MKMAFKKSVTLSKFMSLVLRHDPESFGLSPDQHGFVKIGDLLTVLRKRYGDIQVSDIETVVQNCPKKRFEIRGEKIRAKYGHSIDVILDQKPSEPPDHLYHGTAPAMMGSILKEGLKPMRRKFVHLSKTKEEAFRVGQRKSKNPVIFIVKAKEAHQRGIKFYDMGVVVLTEMVPPEFIRITHST